MMGFVPVNIQTNLQNIIWFTKYFHDQRFLDIVESPMDFRMHLIAEQ